MSILPVEMIKKTRARQALSGEEIKELINGYVDGQIPDYQMAAWLMSVYFQGLSNEEASHLTEAMLHSGEVLDFSKWPEAKVDKHSTGGVGDKTSLILAPIVAAAGLKVPMISGRGLGHTGGTLDKLESIPGFNTQLSLEQFDQVLEKTGMGLIGQTENICPADKKIYALRDVTGTVESIPLICASIMSKKLAEGIDALVLDVKFGSGAFMKTVDDAENLARSLMAIGTHHGKKMSALITSMEQPLGRFVGNSLEVEECVAIMKNEGIYDCNPEDFADTRELSLELSAQMLWLGGAASSAQEGYDLAKKTLDSGAAYEKFAEISAAQGGHLADLPKANICKVVASDRQGFITGFNSEAIGMAGIILGAGRLKQSDVIDPVAGIQLHKKIGDTIESGEKLFTVFASSEQEMAEVESRLLQATEISLQNCDSPSLIEKRISNE